MGWPTVLRLRVFSGNGIFSDETMIIPEKLREMIAHLGTLGNSQENDPN